MADTHETTEALIAEYRADADKMDTHELPQPTTQYLRIMLDRIEAAMKRERAKIEADALEVGGIVEAERKRERGDAAKLREALIKARSAICQFARHQCQSLSWENSNIQANCGDVLCSWRGLCDAKTAINAALAATEKEGGNNG